MKNPFCRNPLLLTLALTLPFTGVSLACTPRGEPDKEAEMDATALSYLALGDSYTIGEGVAPELRWPVQLSVGLRETGVKVEDPVIIARTGWTTDELEEGIRGADPGGPYGLVSLLIGVNNQYRGRGLEEYRTQLRDLLEQALGFAGGRRDRVFVLSIPDWGAMPFAQDRDREAIGTQIDAFNGVMAEEAGALGILFIDITDISRQVAPDPAMVAEDGLHPSGDQYALWAQRALPMVRGLLGGN